MSLFRKHSCKSNSMHSCYFNMATERMLLVFTPYFSAVVFYHLTVVNDSSKILSKPLFSANDPNAVK